MLGRIHRHPDLKFFAFLLFHWLRIFCIHGSLWGKSLDGEQKITDPIGLSGEALKNAMFSV